MIGFGSTWTVSGLSRVGGEIVARPLDGASLAQPPHVIEEEIDLDRLGMIPVDALALGLGEVLIFAVVGVLGQDGNVLGPDGVDDRVRNGSLARARAARHPDHQPAAPLKSAHPGPPLARSTLRCPPPVR